MIVSHWKAIVKRQIEAVQEPCGASHGPTFVVEARLLTVAVHISLFLRGQPCLSRACVRCVEVEMASPRGVAGLGPTPSTHHFSQQKKGSAVRHQKRLSDLSEVERAILEKIIALLKELPCEMSEYFVALAQLRKERLGVQGRGRGDLPRGFVQSRSTRLNWKS